MTLIWILIILGIFMFLVNAQVIEHFSEDEDTDHTRLSIESDYDFPVRQIELGRDPGAEAGRGGCELPRCEEIRGKLPESATQTIPVPLLETNHLITNGEPLPTSEVSDEIAPVIADHSGSEITIGAQGTPIEIEGSPSIQQFKSIGVTQVNRIPNTNIVHQSGLLNLRSTEDEFGCISECQNQVQCGMYTYQPKQQICYLYQKPSDEKLSQHFERAPTYRTGFLEKKKI